MLEVALRTSFNISRLPFKLLYYFQAIGGGIFSLYQVLQPRG